MLALTYTQPVFAPYSKNSHIVAVQFLEEYAHLALSWYPDDGLESKARKPLIYIDQTMLRTPAHKSLVPNIVEGFCHSSRLEVRGIYFMLHDMHLYVGLPGKFNTLHC